MTKAFIRLPPLSLVRALSLFAICALSVMSERAACAAVTVDLQNYSPACDVLAARDGDRLRIAWPMADGEFGRLVLNLGAGDVLEVIGISQTIDGEIRALLRDVEPAVFITVGTREMPPDKPDWQKWQVFFDNPHTRPHESFISQLQKRSASVASDGRRLLVTIDELRVGRFKGALQFVIYPHCRLIQCQALVATDEDGRAIVYDMAILGDAPGWQGLAWYDTEGALQRREIEEGTTDSSIAVRHRTIVAECAGGALAIFPPPHQFFFPRDWTDNLSTVWHGRGHLDLAARYGVGLRNPKTGGGNFVPWFNAPPGTAQRLGMFLLLSGGDAEEALQEVLRFTHQDRFPELPGHLTFTSHWHMAIAVAAQERRKRGEPDSIPDFVPMFQDMNVNMVHLGEFHGDGHQRDPGPLRLPELQAMFDECQRLSDDKLLFIPGEEINTFLGLETPGRHPGHWMSLFPRPVYWTLQRAADQPFAEDHPEFGRLYHVGSRADMQRLIAAERALVWAAHPRIKASSWTPDVFREEDFYLDDSWLGGAWKAMPADLSQPRLGQRVLDLLDDMANWGQRKYAPGEVDVFKLDHTHELYGHMNVNYLRLKELPRFDQGWSSVLDALRRGAFFVTTGEVLIRDFRVGGKVSGEELTLSSASNSAPEVQVDLQWTFPLTFAEIVSGDGDRVYRQYIDLTDTQAFGNRSLSLRPQLAGRHWVRFEVWDCATNGAFTQPIWLRP